MNVCVSIKLTFILGSTGRTASDPIASFKTASPFAFVCPTALCFNAESASFALQLKFETKF